MTTVRELIAILQQADPESDAEVAVWEWLKHVPMPLAPLRVQYLSAVETDAWPDAWRRSTVNTIRAKID